MPRRERTKNWVAYLLQGNQLAKELDRRGQYERANRVRQIRDERVNMMRAAKGFATPQPYGSREVTSKNLLSRPLYSGFSTVAEQQAIRKEQNESIAAKSSAIK